MINQAQLRSGRVCTLVSARKDGTDKGNLRTPPLLRLLLPTRGGEARYLSLDGSMGHEYSHSTVMFFSDERETRRGEARRKQKWRGRERLALAKDES
jgi:hypothetical protein